MVVSHLHETGVKTILTVVMKVSRYFKRLSKYYYYRIFILFLEVIKYLFIYINDQREFAKL